MDARGSEYCLYYAMAWFFRCGGGLLIVKEVTLRCNS